MLSSTVSHNTSMKGSPCCAGLMRSCLHTYRTKTNLTQHIIQPWGGVISQVWGGHQPTMGGHQPTMGGPSAKYGGVINQVWGGINQLWGGISQVWGGAISQVWGGGIFQLVCTGSQNPQNYFSNTYVLPSVNRTAGPIILSLLGTAAQYAMHVICSAQIFLSFMYQGEMR